MELKIYRVVNNRLVEIPNRDSNKRYLAFLGPEGKPAYRELTDPESNIRDQEELASAQRKQAVQSSGVDPRIDVQIRQKLAEFETRIAALENVNSKLRPR